MSNSCESLAENCDSLRPEHQHAAEQADTRDRSPCWCGETQIPHTGPLVPWLPSVRKFYLAPKLLAIRLNWEQRNFLSTNTPSLPYQCGIDRQIRFRQSESRRSFRRTATAPRRKS